uniref:HECT domain-containing protein n=1 Tax=Meloidogyne hapla TaxID=6305 RepID=A0A1I8BDM1_MELHA
MIVPVTGQFNARNYPDPRMDPFSCRLILPGQVCDPAEVLTPDERRILNEKITRLSQDVLQTAFHRSVGHFRLGSYAQGLEGMVEYIVSAYGSAHIVQTPAIGDGIFPTNTQPFSSLPSSSGTGQFTAIQGVRQKTNINKLEKFDFEDIPEEDRLWVRILVKALTQCGDDNLTLHVKAIAEGFLK